jgi:hypothetical protein
MTQQLAGGVMRMFRLTNEPGGLGLSCTPTGVSLAGVPLLRRTKAGLVPRHTSEIASLLRSAYGEDPTGLQSRLGVIAEALNTGDFATAMIAAVHTRTPELSPEAALRLAHADADLAKYGYNPNEPRDWQGRWTSDGAASPISTVGRDIEHGVDTLLSDRRQRVDEIVLSDAAESSDSDDGHEASEPASLEQTFEQKYDNLGPIDFAKQVIQFGDWVGREGKNLSPAEMAHALAEYSFLQDRLSLWLDYDYKPPTAQGNLLSAALTLYQGAINGGIVRVGHFPESMVDVLGTASLFSEGPPRRPSAESIFEEAPVATLQAPKEMEGLGGIADRSAVNITWDGGIPSRENFEIYIEKEDPNVEKLPPKSTTFDLMNWDEGEAISAKTMNTLSAAYIKNPQNIYKKVVGYVDDTVNYERRKDSDVDPADIKSKTIHLAIPEWTSPTQWRHLNRAIVYGKDNGVKIVITRIRE